ncbi:hypothetical protein AYO39_01605 [Actinobacteria bacterium SCGC AG-212-D09]|nr:hypothetical protein AYO39_01605 [Actinobacteria bacterium SCGC AG-212-D09]
MTNGETQMKKFVVLYHAPLSAVEQMASATPEQAKAGMDAWMTWSHKAGEAIIDLGAPLEQITQGTENTNNGNGSGTTVGYSILQANTEEEILTLLQDHPHLHTPGGSIEVLATLPIPGA